MNKKRVLLDIDGVVAEFVVPMLSELTKITGKKYDKDDVTEWELAKALKLSKDEADKLKLALSMPGFCRSLPVIPGAVDGVRELMEHTEVYVCTSPYDSDTWAREREAWLFEHFKISRSSIISTSAKHVCRADILIEDKEEMIHGWLEEYPTGFGLLFSQPWNNSYTYRKDVIRVTDWSNIIDGVIPELK